MKFDFYLGSEADFDDWVFDGCRKAFSMLDLKLDINDKNNNNTDTVQETKNRTEGN